MKAKIALLFFFLSGLFRAQLQEHSNELQSFLVTLQNHFNSGVIWQGKFIGSKSKIFPDNPIMII